jgi:hypothetical protein
MTILWILVLVILYVIVITMFLAFAFYFFRSEFFSDAPFVPVRSKAVPYIIKALNLKPGNVLYDLGCGDGRVVGAALTAEPRARGIGIEINLPIALFARWMTRKTSAIIKTTNMFKEDFSSATHIYCYLTPPTLAKLEPIIITSCKSGTHIITCDFQFPTLIPIEQTPIPAGPKQLGRTLYRYIV